MASRLQSALASGHFVLTAEVTPPLSTRAEDLLAKADPLKGVADAVNVVDGASARVHMDCVAAAAILLQHEIEPILQLTCRDRNRIALQSALIGAYALGARNVLFLRGDDPKAGDQPDAKPVFDLDSAALVATARAMREQHALPNGRAIAGDADFFIGVTDAPAEPRPDWAPTALKRKVDAGAQFIQTQFCMDAEIVRAYIAALRAHGINTPVLIGVAPLASAKSARWMKEKLFGVIIPDWMVERLDAAADPKAEGAAICIDFIKELQTIDGVAGAHIMAPLNEAAIPGVIRAVR
jgi:methylenetetrahydrofolate reductase (NADPH)